MDEPSRASLDLTPPEGRAIVIEQVRAWVSTRLSGTGSLVKAWIDGVQDSTLNHLVEFANGLNNTESVATASRPAGSPSMQVALTCKGSDRPARATLAGPSSCSADETVPLVVHGLEATLSESVAPAGAALGGTLLADKPMSGVRSLEYSVSDDQSGVARVEALIGGTVVASRDLSGRCSYADWTACPSRDRDTLSVDTRSLPDGPHPLTLRVTDAAGNRHDEPVQNIEIKNQTTAPVTEIGRVTSPPAHLTVSFASSSGTSITVPFGQRVRVRGRLMRAAQSVVAGAQVDIFERTASAGAVETAVASVRTQADGTFSYTLASGRPSRTVRIAYGSSSARVLRVKVRAAATLTASLRGTLLRFSGRVLSAPLPPRGKRVIIQGTAPGYEWGEAATVRTDRRGRFSGSYRLTARRPGVRLRLRVRVPTERGYPYLGYTSPPLELRVR